MQDRIALNADEETAIDLDEIGTRLGYFLRRPGHLKGLFTLGAVDERLEEMAMATGFNKNEELRAYD